MGRSRANFVDAQRNGGRKNNPSDVLGVGVCVVTSIAIVFTLGSRALTR
jgi:hypothetical protein